MLFSKCILSQTLIASYPLPNAGPFNLLWGITQLNDTLWGGSDYYGTLFKITKTGIVIDSLHTPYTFNHGLTWENNGFWIARDYNFLPTKLFKVNLQGIKIDSIQLPAVIGGSPDAIGGIFYDGGGIWFTIYYPENATYPYTYAYRYSLSEHQYTDTIPLRGKQPQGITLKGDTILYVNDFFNDGTPERIFAYRKAVGDTLFSFPSPDPDGDCNPRGLFWDGQFLWLNAERIGPASNAYRVLYKYSLSGLGNPQITTSTNSIDFGNVIINNTANQTLGITNTGSAKLILSSFTMTNSRFTISPNNMPDTISINQTKNYTVSFTPNVYDTTSGELRIASNDAGTPLKTVNLRGKGIYNGSNISLSSSSYNFNARRINSLCGWFFTVTNTGSQPLQINSITFSTQRFKLDTVGLHFPLIIDTQKTKQLRIWFNPNATTNFSDSAVISSNAVNMPSAKIQLSGSGQNNQTALGDIMWEGIIPDDPNSSYNDYQPTSIKQIGDVNSDGINDVIVTTGNYWTICFNGNSSVSSDILWKFTTDFGSINTGSVGWEDAMQIREDVNGDGIPDVVIGCGGGNEMVYTLSGRTGAVIWEYGDSIGTSDGDIMGIRVDKDYNNDGVKDVLVSASGTGQGNGRHAIICLNGLTGQEIFKTYENAYFTYDCVATESGGAISVDVDGGYTYSLIGFNNQGSYAWSYPVNGAVWSLKEMPDINNNGHKEILGYYGFNGNAFTVDGTTGAQISTISFGIGNNGRIQLLDDLNKNGFADYTLSGPQSVNRVDSKTDSILWSAYPQSSYIRGIDDIGDIDGDTIHDIAVATQQPGKIMVLDGKTGSTLFEYLFGNNLTQRGDRVSKLNSIDGNVTAELIGGCRDGRIKCFSGGPNQPIGIKPVSSRLPSSFKLYQNYPNPFNPSTTIKFDIPSMKSKTVEVTLKVYDILGKEASVILNNKLAPGSYEIKWNANSFASGIYFYKISVTGGAGDFTDVRKMVLVK
ncbi:MAG: choice-of-anchor D domain-containing protein [Ignavibacteria bacterium]